MEILLGCLLIMLARVVDVSLGTLRTLLLVRGKRLQAAVAGFFEVIVYILALKQVFQTLDQPISILAYALGFALGNYCGSLLEERLIQGYLTVQAITLHNPEELAATLRSEGFGVTVISGMGKEGTRQLLNIVLPRNKLGKLYSLVEGWDSHAFVTVFDARAARGGNMLTQRK